MKTRLLYFPLLMIGLYLLSIKTLSKKTLLEIEIYNVGLGCLFAISLILIAYKISKRAETIADLEARTTDNPSTSKFALLRFTLLVIAALAIFSPLEFTYENAGHF